MGKKQKTEATNIAKMETFAISIPADHPGLAMGKFDPDEAGVDIGDIESTPYLMFFDKKSNLAAAIQAQLGVALTMGERILVLDEDTFIRANDASFLVLDEFEYYAIVDTDDRGRILRAQTEEPDDGVGSPYKQQILSITLAFVPNLKLPVVTLTSFRATKCPFVRDHLRAVARAKTPKWAAKNELNGAIAGALEPRYRVVTSPVMQNKPGRKDPETGKRLPYCRASGHSRTITLEQAHKLQGWFTNEKCAADLSRIKEHYKKRVAYVKGVIENPPED